MTKGTTRVISCALAAGLSFSSISGAPAEDEVSAGEKLFALKVKPLFAEKCLACHGDEPEKIKGDFDMRSREAILKGGETFGKEVLMPGKGESSFLYLTTTRTEEDYEMPPKEADQLTEEQQWWIRDWINAGAPWLGDERVAQIQEMHAEGEQVEPPLSPAFRWGGCGRVEKANPYQLKKQILISHPQRNRTGIRLQ
ncbi:MAG: hypothetical protein NWR21_01135 [Verrucomicrobiales bacterium]|nr:hypothetical protein [Verrucomicrobiales bacterium]